MNASIRTPGSIWAKLIEQQAANAKKPDGRGDGFVFFLGSRGSGKSTLLNRFLYPSRVEVPKPSEGLEYTYARKPSAFDHEKKDIAHIWEVGGSQEFADEVANGDQIFLTAKQVTTAVVVVVVDLSDPGSALSNLTGWLDQIKKKLSGTYEKFEKKGLQLPEQLRQRAKTKLYSQNEDKDAVYHSGVSIVIAATKYDAIKDEDPEVKKVLARSLRWAAHSHGAFLLYLSNLHTSMAGGSEVKDGGVVERSLLDNFTRLANHLIFTGLEKKPIMKLQPQLDHNGPLMVPAGTDKFRDIGRPRGTVDGNIQAGMQEWRELCENFFPPKDTKAAKTAKFIVDERYREEEVDLVYARKLQELEAYKKEQEIAKEMAKKRAAAAKAEQKAVASAKAVAKPAAAKKTAAASPKAGASADQAPSAAAPATKKKVAAKPKPAVA